MKLPIAVCTSLMLFATSSFADPVQSTLPAGKPAGVRQAQEADHDNTMLYILGGLAVVGIIIGVAVSGGDDNSSSGTVSVTPH